MYYSYLLLLVEDMETRSDTHVTKGMEDLVLKKAPASMVCGHDFLKFLAVGQTMVSRLLYAIRSPIIQVCVSKSIVRNMLSVSFQSIKQSVNV